MARCRWLLATLACGLVSAPAVAAPASPHSAFALARGEGLVSAGVGFPHLEVRGQWGVGGNVDLGPYFTSAWGHVGRAGFAARWASSQSKEGAVAVRLLVDGAVGAVANDTWSAYDGRLEGAAALELAGSLASGATIVTFGGGIRAVGTRTPPPEPLGGPASSLALGAVVGLRVAVEWALENGLVLSLPVGLEMHAHRLDPLWAVPTFSIGCGFPL